MCEFIQGYWKFILAAATVVIIAFIAGIQELKNKHKKWEEEASQMLRNELCKHLFPKVKELSSLLLDFLEGEERGEARTSAELTLGRMIEFHPDERRKINEYFDLIEKLLKKNSHSDRSYQNIAHLVVTIGQEFNVIMSKVDGFPARFDPVSAINQHRGLLNILDVWDKLTGQLHDRVKNFKSLSSPSTDVGEGG